MNTQPPSRSVIDVEPFQNIRNRTPVVIEADICTGCEVCIPACPQSVLKVIADIRRVEGLVAVVYNPALCTACRQCEDVCPDFCITVTVPDEGEA